MVLTTMQRAFLEKNQTIMLNEALTHGHLCHPKEVPSLFKTPPASDVSQGAWGRFWAGKFLRRQGANKSA